MGIEIERKFLLRGDGWRGLATGEIYRQGYLYGDGTPAVRVRIVGEKAFLTIKSRCSGLASLEFEYPLPLEDAHTLLEQVVREPPVEKIRYRIPCNGLIWEVDEFLGLNQGLLLAEVELEREDQSFELPPWVGEEVTADPRYYNAALAKHPFRNWTETKHSSS